MDTQRLLQAFRHLYHDGLSMAAALQLENIPASSYYTFKRNSPQEDSALRAKAEASVTVEVEVERTRALRMREVQQLEIEELLLRGVTPVLTALMESAQTTDSLHTQIAALREIRQWLESGMFQTTTSSAAEEPEKLVPPSLPDFLSSGQISEMSVKSVAGDEIILKRGDAVEGEATETLRKA